MLTSQTPCRYYNYDQFRVKMNFDEINMLTTVQV